MIRSTTISIIILIGLILFIHTSNAQPTPTATPTYTQGLPEGYDWHYNPDNEHYYAIVKNKISWPEARIFAESISCYLASITSINEEHFVLQYFSREQFNCPKWIGLHRDGLEWKWVTGEPFEYENFADGEPSGDGDYVVTSWNVKEEWNDYSYTEKRDFIIEFDNSSPNIPPTPTPTPTPGLPEDYEWHYNPDNGHYYAIVLNPISWPEARIFAESISCYLATITSRNEEDFIFQHFNLEKYRTPKWIGLSRDGLSWKWVTGEPFEYENFADGEPSGDGDYVVTSWGVKEEWNDYSFTEKRYFIIEFDNSSNIPPTPTPTPTTGLSEGYEWKYNPNNGHYYSHSHQPMLWEDANIFAQELGGYLLTITEEQEHQWIISTFSHYGVFLGLHNDDGWKWVSGESFNYSNWSPGEPSGDGSIVEITGLGWNDRPDDNEKYFIVEIDQIPDPTPTPIFHENLVGYWKFDGNAMDSSGYNHNGTLENGATISPEGYMNSALKCDGINDNVLIDTSPKLTFSSDDQFTISLWFNLSGDSEWLYDPLIASGRDSDYSTDYIFIDINSDRVRVHMEGDANNENVAIHYYGHNYRDNTWHQITVIHDIKNVYLYIDNELKASQLNHPAQGVYNFEGTWGIGHEPYFPKYYLKGMIDEVRIYNSAVYPSSITNQGLPEGYDWKYNPDNGHYYSYVQKGNNWESVKSQAESIGGYLVTINSKQEDDWLYQTFSEIAQYETWIGLDENGWVSGEPVQYLNYIDPLWGGSGTCLFYLRAQNQKWWKRPKQDIISFIVEYNNIYPVPTPTPTPENWSSLNGESLEDNYLSAGAPAGYTPGKIQFGEIPEGQGSDGNGMEIRLAPGQGVFISSSNVFETTSLVQLTGSFRANNKEVAIALVGLNSPVDGQIGYANIRGESVPVGDYRKFNLIFAPPSGKVQYAIQAVNSTFSHTSTTVWVDNIEVKSYEPTFGLQPVELEVNGSFNSGLEHLMVNINYNDGSIIPFFESMTDVALRMSIDPSNKAANIGTTCQGLYYQFPFCLLGQVSVKRASMPGGGMMALVLTNGFQNLALYRKADEIKTIYDAQDELLIIGGDFTTNNPDIPISAFVQLGGPDADASVVVDDLMIMKH